MMQENHPSLSNNGRSEDLDIASSSASCRRRLLLLLLLSVPRDRSLLQESDSVVSRRACSHGAAAGSWRRGHPTSHLAGDECNEVVHPRVASERRRGTRRRRVADEQERPDVVRRRVRVQTMEHQGLGGLTTGEQAAEVGVDQLLECGGVADGGRVDFEQAEAMQARETRGDLDRQGISEGESTTCR